MSRSSTASMSCSLILAYRLTMEYMEMFQHHSSKTDLIRREFRPHGQEQATTLGWVQVSRRHLRRTSRKSWPCVWHEPQTTRRIIMWADTTRLRAQLQYCGLRCRCRYCGLLGIFGEVESIGTSTRGMEKLSLRDGAVFLTLLQTGTRGETSKGPRFTKTGQEPVFMCNTHLAVRTSGVAAQRITSVAWKRSVGGIVRPRAAAVFRLMTSSNVMGCSTGRSAGLTPVRILST